MRKMKIAPAVRPNHESKQEQDTYNIARRRGFGVCTCVCVGSVQQGVLSLIAEFNLLLQGLL